MMLIPTSIIIGACLIRQPLLKIKSNLDSLDKYGIRFRRT